MIYKQGWLDYDEQHQQRSHDPNFRDKSFIMLNGTGVIPPKNEDKKMLFLMNKNGKKQIHGKKDQN